MEKLWFHDAVESLFSKGLKERVTPELKAQVRPFVDLDRPLLPAYSAEAVEASLRIVGAKLYPELSDDQRLFALGPFAFAAFSETMIGKAGALRAQARRAEARARAVAARHSSTARSW